MLKLDNCPNCSGEKLARAKTCRQCYDIAKRRVALADINFPCLHTNPEPMGIFPCRLCHDKAYKMLPDQVAKSKERNKARYWNNRDAQIAYIRYWRDKHREHVNGYSRNYSRKSKYGLSTEEFEAMVSTQDGKCAICGERPVPDRLGRYLVIDHNHVTGKVRELLCFACNAGIGHFKENVESLYKAINYLTRHDGQKTLKEGAV